MASNTVANAVKATMTKKPFWANASKIVAIGRNYADHITELGNQRPSKPFYFLKPLSSVYFRPSINKPREKEKDVIFIPHDVNVHYEVELGIIMRHALWNLGHSRKTLSPESFEKRWNDAISGYFIGIDLTARNLQDEAKKSGLPWTAAKGYDRFLPISRFIPKTKIPDPHNVRLQLQLNGNIVQDDNTNLMLFKIPELLEAITDVMTLNYSDMILTGTPKGVGQVVSGDVMKASCFVEDELVESFEVSAVNRVNSDGTPW